MGRLCAVANCRASGKGVRMFSFPQEDNPVYNDWIAFCYDSRCPEDPEFVVKTSNRICEAHFDCSSYNDRNSSATLPRLKHNAIPKVVTPHETPTKRTYTKYDSIEQETPSLHKVPRLDGGDDARGVSAGKFPVRMHGSPAASSATQIGARQNSNGAQQTAPSPISDSHFVDMRRQIGVNKSAMRYPTALKTSGLKPPPIAGKVLPNGSGDFTVVNTRSQIRTASQTPMKRPVNLPTLPPRVRGQNAVNSKPMTQTLQISPVTSPVRLPTVQITANGERVVVKGSNSTQHIYRTADIKKQPASEIVLEKNVDELLECQFEQYNDTLSSTKEMKQEVVHPTTSIKSKPLRHTRLHSTKQRSNAADNHRDDKSTVDKYMNIADFLEECKLETSLDPLELNSPTTPSVAATSRPSQPSKGPKKKQIIILRTYKPSAPTLTPPPVTMHKQILHTLEANSFERERIRLMQTQTALLRAKQRSKEGFRMQLLAHDQQEHRKNEAHRKELLANRKEVLALKRLKLEFLMQKRAKKAG